MKVLVVEDDDLVRTVAVDCLEEAGFDVIEAATGEEALERCKERVADALFTDIRLPGALVAGTLPNSAASTTRTCRLFTRQGFLSSHHASFEALGSSTSPTGWRT
jgi:CheY-like chemotaxis protein